MKHTALNVMCLMMLWPVGFVGAQTVIHVPGDQTTIQAGINAASTGDVVEVAPGLYDGVGNRDLRYYGKAITVRSSGGAELTEINCGGLSQGVVFADGEGRDSVLQGFTISNCVAPDGIGGGKGGGILVNNPASPTIVKCVIQLCVSDSYGGGLYSDFGATPFIDSCLFKFNTAFRSGGGIYAEGTVEVWNTVFQANTADYSTYQVGHGGGVFTSWSGSEFRNCHFIGNQASFGAGAYFEGTQTVRNCLFVGNDANLNPAVDSNKGAAIFNHSGSTEFGLCTFASNSVEGEGASVHVQDGLPHVTNSIVWDSPANGLTGPLTAAHSDVWQTGAPFPGNSNFSADPIFVTGPGPVISNSYYLSNSAVAGQVVTSPCVDVGSYFLEYLCGFGGSMDTCAEFTTTRTDLENESDEGDIGYHYIFLIFEDGFDSSDTSAWAAAVSAS